MNPFDSYFRNKVSIHLAFLYRTKTGIKRTKTGTYSTKGDYLLPYPDTVNNAWNFSPHNEGNLIRCIRCNNG